jgi:hypothetical protein
MFYRIAISLAAVTIGMSCIATDALARGGGGGGKGGGNAITTGVGGPTVKGAGKDVRVIPRTTGVRGPTGGGGKRRLKIESTTGVGGPTGGGEAAGARYYAPALYDSNAACGRYPYPPCKNVPTR